MTYDCDQGTKQLRTLNLSAVAVKKEHESVGHVPYIIASVSDWW